MPTPESSVFQAATWVEMVQTGRAVVGVKGRLGACLSGLPSRTPLSTADLFAIASR